MQILKMFLLLSLLTGCMEQQAGKKTVSQTQSQTETIKSQPAVNIPQPVSAAETQVVVAQTQTAPFQAEVGMAQKTVQISQAEMIKAQAAVTNIAPATATVSAVALQPKLELIKAAVDTNAIQAETTAFAGMATATQKIIPQTQQTMGLKIPIGTVLSKGQLTVDIIKFMPKKYVVIMANWNDGNFAAEARNLATRLKSEGIWKVILLDENYPLPLNPGNMQTVIQKALEPVQRGDTVWMEILGHGSEVIKKLVTYDVLLGQINNLSEHYPYLDGATVAEDATILATHFIDVHMNRMGAPANLYTTMIRDITLDLSSRGINLAVLDHSCYAGATARLIEYISNQSSDGTQLCAISTTGVLNPGKTDGPFVGPFLQQSAVNGIDRSTITMNDYANYISEKYYAEHVIGKSRLQSIGYRTGCNHTMPLRDTLSLARDAYSSYWDWGRHRPSHVAREPQRYTYIEFDPRPVIPNNPRVNIASGLVRWFSESNLKLYTENAFGPWLMGESSIASPAEMAESAETSVLMYQVGVSMQNRILDHGDKVATLDLMLTNMYPFTGYHLNKATNTLVFDDNQYNMTVDSYLREVFTKYCLCERPAEWSIGCSKAELPLPSSFALDPQNLICKNPASFRDFIITDRNIMSTLNAVNQAQKDLIDYSVFNTQVIQHWEKMGGGCVSKSCRAIKL